MSTPTKLTPDERYLKSEYTNLVQAMRLREYSAKLTIVRQVTDAIDMVTEYQVGDQSGLKY
jgi:hypothetical protein